MKAQTILISLSIMMTGGCNNHTETKEETNKTTTKTNELTIVTLGIFAFIIKLSHEK